MTPTEALARAITATTFIDTDDIDIAARAFVDALAALGYEVRPIESPTLLHEVDYDDLRREQAAEQSDDDA